MTLFQFACPYCSGQFEIENPPAGQAVACPHCREMVALPAELPPPVRETQSVAPAGSEFLPPRAEANDAVLPFILDEPISPAARRGRQSATRVQRPPVRRLSREEKELHRARRNLVMMVVGVVVLAVAAVVLSRV